MCWPYPAWEKSGPGIAAFIRSGIRVTAMGSPATVFPSWIPLWKKLSGRSSHSSAISRKKLLESVKTNDATRIQKKVKKIQKDLESKQKELDDLKAETILVIRGVSALDKELLGTLVAEAKDALETLEKQLVQAQEEYEEATKTAKRSNYICNELFTWADVYDTANHDERRAILQQFITEIRVRKDYEISITLNASFNQVEQLKAVSTYDGAEIFEEIS